MANFIYDSKNDKIYQLGINTGYFIALLLFVSVFYFLLQFSNKIPEMVKYYYVLFSVAIIYIIWLAISKFKK